MAQARLSGVRGRVAEQIGQLTEAAELARGCLARELAAQAHGALSHAHETAGELADALLHSRLQLEHYRLWQLQEGRDLLRMRDHDASARLLEQLASRRFEPRREDAVTRVGPRRTEPGALRETATAEQINTRIAHALRAGLTRRGIEILQLVVDGVGTGAIAEDLGLSPKTVQNHLQRIYRTLEVRGRTGAVLWWINLGEAQDDGQPAD
ncbi:hypothetical protein F0L68_17830 [Solihabitans fulvus]|uniref:HTH luxR-type domain-containing protein n=2 Tax=Solihabitans fulvus TaxID=1892852 RepID=A0A5B2XE78_9PSEU|nr:hypothetical protein F0L68_17830 [Solihabitans fulvus]